MTTEISLNETQMLSSVSEVLGEEDTKSVQYTFAKLQLAMAQRYRKKAEDGMKEIESVQQDQSQVAELISQARKLQNACKTGGSAATSDMPQAMADWMEARGLSRGKTDGSAANNYSEWTHNIESLTNYQESISNKTQAQMVYLQDYISQYNAYLQGASSTLSKANSVLSNIIKNSD